MSGNKVMIHTTTYEDLRKIILSERSQPEKKKNHISYDSIYTKCTEETKEMISPPVLRVRMGCGCR